MIQDSTARTAAQNAIALLTVAAGAEYEGDANDTQLTSLIYDIHDESGLEGLVLTIQGLCGVALAGLDIANIKTTEFLQYLGAATSGLDKDK